MRARRPNAPQKKQKAADPAALCLSAACDFFEIQPVPSLAVPGELRYPKKEINAMVAVMSSMPQATRDEFQAVVAAEFLRKVGGSAHGFFVDEATVQPESAEMIALKQFALSRYRCHLEFPA